MRLASRKGFIIILVTISLAILILSASVIVGIGCSELMATRVRNDLLISAYYVAISGAELLYSDLKTKDVVAWDPTTSGSLTVVGAPTIGTYSATAKKTIEGEEFCIVSTGTVNNHTATATVKYGYLADYEGPVPLGAAGEITVDGASNPANLKIDGPVISNSTVTEIGSVDIADGTIENDSMPVISFWLGTEFDTNNDGNYVEDTDSSGTVTYAEAVTQEKETIFADDNAYNSTDGEITDIDAFYYYYTTYLNDAANNKLEETLNIAPGQTYYFTGDQSFDQADIDNSVPIIFVDGNVSILENDQDWQASSVLDHTVVATGNISFTQPTNRPGDIMTLVSWGDFYTTGTMGDKGGVIGDFVIFANGDVTIEDGGKINASIYTNGTITIDTIGDDQGSDHRVINKLTEEWDEDSIPLGLPPGYPDDDFTFGFDVVNQSTQPPVWQRN